MKNFNRKMAKGAAWMVLFKLVHRSLSLISTVILARLLLPADFGLIALAMSIIAALELLSAFSFDIALIQDQKSGRKEYDTVWTFNVLFGVGSGLILLLLASPAAEFYADPRLELVMFALAAFPLLGGLQNIGVIEFRKEMQFNKEFGFLAAQKLAGFSITIPLAFVYENYWALVAGMLGAQLVGVLLSYLLHPYRPRFSLAAAHKLFHFSKWLLINNVLFFFRLRSASFIIGKTADADALGKFTIATEISSLPNEFVAPVNRAVFPGYAKMSHELDMLRQGFLDVIAAISMVVLPAAFGIAATAELLVPVLLGEKWLDVIPLIQILAVFAAITALQTNTGYVFLALGKPKTLTVLGTLYLFILIPLLLWLTPSAGATGAAWAYLLSAMTLMPLYFHQLLRNLKLGITKLASVIWRPAIATTIMLVVVMASMDLSFPFTGAYNKILHLLTSILIGAISYSVTLLALWYLSACPPGPEQYVIEKVLRTIRGRLSLGQP